MKFMMDEYVQGQISLSSLVSPAFHNSTIAPYSSATAAELCNSPDHAAHYQVLGRLVGGFISDPSLNLMFISLYWITE
jgi:hypothetical protein